MVDSRPTKKIFVVGPTESLLTQRGNRHPALAQFLVEQGFSLEYVTSNFYHAEKRWFSREEVKSAKLRAPYTLTVLSCLGYRANISPQRILSNLLFAVKVFFYLLPRIDRSTTLILPSRPVEMIFAAAMLRLLRGASVALDIQDVWPDMLVVDSRLKRLFFRWYCNLYLYSSLRFIDKFFHVAPSFVQWLHRYAPKARSTFIPLGFDLERWEGSKPKTSPSNSSKIHLACVSQLQFQIDIIPLLKALTLRPMYRLKIIGEDGTGQRYAEVVEFIKKHNMLNVEMVGLVKRDQMVEYLRQVDIGVVPMVSASIPNKVFDYIASYTPLLILGENDSSEFVNKIGIGWSVAYNEQAIAEFLDALSWAEISRKADKIVPLRYNFSRDVLHRQILELIEQ